MLFCLYEEIMSAWETACLPRSPVDAFGVPNPFTFSLPSLMCRSSERKKFQRGDGSRTLLMERRKPSQQLSWLPYLGPNAHDIDATIEEASIGLPIAEYKIHASYLLLFVSPA